jgi:integrase
LFSVALAAGLRLGEATGLRWDDVDLETGEIRIRQQLQAVGKRLVLQPLKTDKSRRTLVLPEVCLKALFTHRTRQKEQRLKAGGDWIDSHLVFTTLRRRKAGQKVGGPLGPRNVLRTLHALLESAKLPRRRFHDLRHSYSVTPSCASQPICIRTCRSKRLRALLASWTDCFRGSVRGSDGET